MQYLDILVGIQSTMNHMVHISWDRLSVILFVITNDSEQVRLGSFVRNYISAITI